MSYKTTKSSFIYLFIIIIIIFTSK